VSPLQLSKNRSQSAPADGFGSDEPRSPSPQSSGNTAQGMVKQASVVALGSPDASRLLKKRGITGVGLKVDTAGRCFAGSRPVLNAVHILVYCS
jgi:hypothetical protein